MTLLFELGFLLVMTVLILPSKGLAIPEVGPLLTSEVSSPVPGKRSRKRPGERWLSPPSSPEEPGAPPALKAQKLDPRIPKPRAAEPLLGKITKDGGPEEKNKCMWTSTPQKARRTLLIIYSLYFNLPSFFLKWF